jgi:Bifunctional DNA primase/polymerase, N-terminal
MPEIDRVREFRKKAIDNGYSLVPVRTGSKQPLGKQWQHGETEDRLLAVEEHALNTGILTAGLRCIDVDVDNPDVVREIVAAASRHFPTRALVRRRSNSRRLAVIYSAADGQPGKQSIAGAHGKIEVLGDGQQIVADGTHFWRFAQLDEGARTGHAPTGPAPDGDRGADRGLP